jgi:hypothetical protein
VPPVDLPPLFPLIHANWPSQQRSAARAAAVKRGVALRK